MTAGLTVPTEAPPTRAEKVFLWRRRRGLTQPEAAAQWGVPTEEWRGWEVEGGGAPHQVVEGQPRVEPWEKMALWRRRHGWSVKTAATIMGISHVTLIDREYGKGPWRETYQWWREWHTNHD